ncbi:MULTISPECIES: BsuPI-related putative proteinase inhibitor [Exiguobacterium]|uniref:BsuPI-related putative proteinase inhibitor n=1 Tax=Exiguobacterium TaxID=33986 RepID=UPI0021AF2F67|nr:MULTISPECIES: BsuPI-related putative proteinase inhibitor [Exiguobacterium]MCT4776121.1 BsuPI-related putative proteinase inhibitor [Exiguobacterium aquaticum]MCT4788949.1 BsuPI-related putative proteinase inhibitor [Exiguobacterium mexicanum]
MKKTWLLAIVTTMILVVAACSKEEANPSDVDGNASTPPALLTLETDVSYDAETKQLSATVSMTNPNEVPVNVTFNSSQRFQMTVMNGDTTVFDYGSEYMFTESIIEETWAPGEKKVFDEVFPLTLEAGEYTVDFVGLAQVEGAPEMAVTDQQSLTVEAAEVPTEETPEEPAEDTTEETTEEPAEAPSDQPAQTDGSFRDVAIKLNGNTLDVSGYTDVEEFEWSVSDGHNLYAQGAAEVTSGGFTFGVLLDEEPAAGKTLFLEMTPIGGDVASFRIQ